MSIQIPPRPAPMLPQKAGPIGPGAGVLITEYPLERYSQEKSPQLKMLRAWNLAISVPWIAAAEDVIASRFAGVEWHLEDENDETIDETSLNPDARAAFDLIEYPQRDPSLGAPYTRTELWSLVSRTMGPCGSAFLLMDRLEAFANTPEILQPIAPWRFTAQEDPAGNLIGWWVDRTQTDPGIALRTDEVIHYALKRAYRGHFGVGLVESALLKLQNAQGLDSHLGMVISAGGRLSGIMSPESGTIEPQQMADMERDWRTVVEQQDAAKRLQLVRAPVKFTPTTLTPHELQLRDMMNGARDDLLALWGVPFPMIGGAMASGMNSGDTRKYDEAALWQGPVHSRLTVFREGTQYQMLDRWAARGAVIELEIDEPEFDDDSPRYDLLGKSLNTPLTNRQRLSLVGLPPTGDPAIDNAILLPATIVPYAIAPDEVTSSASAQTLGRAPIPESGSATPQSAAAGETSDGKALIRPPAPSRLHPRIAPLHASLIRLRTNIAKTTTPILKSRVRDVLQEQKRDIAARLREHSAHIAANRRDSAIWFAKDWDRKLTAALRPHLELMASTVNAQIVDVLPPKPPAAKAAPPGTVERVLTRGAAKVTKINDTTRGKVQDAIVRGLDAGLTAVDVADLIEGVGSEEDAAAIGLDMGSLFDDYRAETIARTELMDAYNGAALFSYGDAGVSTVTASDGDEDPECAERDGQEFSIEEADGIEDHPNGTLDWIPNVNYGALASDFAEAV